MSKIAIIGTAGRDRTKPMSQALWDWMVRDVTGRVPQGAHVVSGGAAWADHLAVELFLNGHAEALTLHLPAPFEKRFLGPNHSSASAANYYHSIFSRTRGTNTLAQIERALDMGAEVTYEPARVGYSGLLNRNTKVAKADQLIAYTFSVFHTPADGGTKDTWSKCSGLRTHVSLPHP